MQTIAMNDASMLRCIDNCAQCHQICLQTMAYCLREGGGHAAGDHIRILADCAQICATSGDFMLRQSTLHGHTCRACAAVCAQCARDCRAIARDQHMAACASLCEQCAQSCEEMSA